MEHRLTPAARPDVEGAAPENALGLPCAGYAAVETLLQGRRTLRRAIRQTDGGPVLIEALDARTCSPSEVGRLRHEYEIGRSLDLRAIVKPLALDTEQGAPILVLEDFAGRPLERLIAGPMATGRFLELATRIAGAVASLHGEGIVHKDLKPENILVHVDTSEVRIAGLGLATRLPREHQAPRPPQLIEGSLPYMSPEQTGRMNRAVDSRTDLYSLGVTFYRMLTGALPFEARDPLEWLHCHVARSPAPPSRLVPQVPEVLGRIVTKLLAKMAEDRYQTARGLEHDLLTCLQQWRRSGRIEPFTLGERDVPDRLQLPQKLYGREEQVRALLSAFERVADGGAPELVLVSGYSGIGKSSLVRELEKPVLGRRGLFAQGKFDQHRRGIPYSTIAQAFGGLVLDVLVEGEQRVATWRERLRASLGMNARLVVDVIPELELLIGAQHPAPELPLDEAKNRFHLVFRRFVGAFARPEQPLALFLDDLQWADPASLELLADVLTHVETRHLLVIGAYRDNEVAPDHPLMMALDEVRRSELPIQEIVLAPLSSDHLRQLVADTLRRSAADVEPLALLLEEKTAGNPYFALQFLTSLEQEGLLRLDPAELAWRCDVDAARAKGYTDNVVDLMVAKLRRLSPDAQEAVNLAACAGNVADAATLSVLRGRSLEQTHRELWDLVRAGLLLRSGDAYRFSHDRVQQVAYALLPEELRPATHLRIGRALLAHTPPELRGEKAFEIANQLNRGARLIEDEEERYGLAELDLVAGQRAKASAAFGPAAQYLAAGVAMLPAGAWDDRYSLAHALHIERAQCEYLAGDFAEAERCLVSTLCRARTLAEKAAVHRLRIQIYTIRGEVERAIDSVQECAALFGIELERHPSQESVAERYADVMSRIGDRSIEALVDLPPMTDPDLRALVEVMMTAIGVVYQYDLRLDLAMVCAAVRLSLEHGNAPSSCGAFTGLGNLLGPVLGRYQEGRRFARLAHALVQRGGLLAYLPDIYIGEYMASFWTRHVGLSLRPLEEGLRAGAAVGSLTMSCFLCIAIASVRLASGDPLDEVDRDLARLLSFVRGARYEQMEDVILGQRRLVRRLRDRVSPPASTDAAPAEDDRLDERIRRRVPLVRCWYHVLALQERFLFGDYRGAASVASEAEPLRWTLACWWEGCEYSYFHALTVASLHAEASAHERERCLGSLRAEVEHHRIWAENCPENFENRHALVSAELARVEGRVLDAERLYEQAIRSARQNGFTQNEAIACELASRFYRARGFDLTADGYLREARARYLRWGADAKVAQLERLHPQLAERPPASATATFAARPEELDLLSVVKASQTISGEIETERLIGTLLRAVLEQGGARRGCLLLERDGALFVEAEASMEEAGVVTRSARSIPAEASGLVPVTVVQYALATRRPVVLRDVASGRGKFASDHYFATRPTRSVLCLPILRQAELVGLLYLENRHVADAFTPDRLTTLSLLASQAAISVENARLLREERQARQRAAFLSEAGALLSESLDYEETLARLSRLCVESLADWCVLDLVEGRELRRVAGACADAAREPVLEMLRRRHPARWDSPHPAARSLRRGEAILLPEITDDMHRSHADDEDHFKLVLALGTRSAVVVPLVARGQTLGVFTMASGTRGRYGQADLELAQELARRASSAIDNARLYREVQRADRRKSEFIAVLSHELRNPLAPIRTGLQLVRRFPPENPVASRALETMARQTEHISHLLDDLLDVTRLSHGRIELHRARVDLCGVVRSACDDLRPAFDRAGVSLDVGLPPDPLWSDADATRVAQVVANLLQNAAKFTAAGGSVTVEVADRGGRAEISVRDTGVGMEPSEVERMFEPFAQAKQGLARTQGGLGLGLALAKGLVELHGGSIRGRSEGPGRGSEFVVTLPLSGPGSPPGR